MLELKKFNSIQVETEDQRWLKFFKDGERLNDEALPDWMITQEMKQAMSTTLAPNSKEQKKQAMMQLIKKCAALPTLDDRSPEEILGHQQNNIGIWDEQ